MFAKKTSTWCVVPEKTTDVHLQLTWPILHLRSIRSLNSDSFETPLRTDNGKTTQWKMTVDQDIDKYILELYGLVYTDNVTVEASFSVEDNHGNKKIIGNVKKMKLINGQLRYGNGKSDAFCVDNVGPIIIHCDIFINKIDDNKKVDKMKELLTNAKDYHSDVIMVCEDGEIECHKSILCLNSSYFKNMFDSGMVEARTGRIPVGLDRQSCLVLLNYFYTGRLDASKVTVKLLLEVNKILMDDLKESCLKDLAKNIRMENVVKILEMTDEVEAKDVQLAAEQFLVYNRKHLTPQLKQQLKNYSNFGNLMFKILEKYV